MIRPTHLALLALPLATALAGASVLAAHHTDRQTALKDSQQRAYEQAVSEFRAGHPSAAYGRLMSLADAGHVPSAQLALVMLQQGKALFGTEWSASAAQQARWRAHVVNGLRGYSPPIVNGSDD